MSALCIGCGCGDFTPCINVRTDRACSWIVVDRRVDAGVCSSCRSHLARWDAGERALLGPADFDLLAEMDSYKIGMPQMWKICGKPGYRDATMRAKARTFARLARLDLIHHSRNGHSCITHAGRKLLAKYQRGRQLGHRPPPPAGPGSRPGARSIPRRRQA
jgi:hypothetical protein